MSKDPPTSSSNTPHAVSTSWDDLPPAPAAASAGWTQVPYSSSSSPQRHRTRSESVITSNRFQSLLKDPVSGNVSPKSKSKKKKPTDADVASTVTSSAQLSPSSSTTSQRQTEMAEKDSGQQLAELNKTMAKLLELQTESLANSRASAEVAARRAEEEREAAANRAEEERRERENERKLWRAGLDELGKDMRRLAENVRGSSADPEAASGSPEATSTAKSKRDKSSKAGKSAAAPSVHAEGEIVDDGPGEDDASSGSPSSSDDDSRDERLVTPTSPIATIDSTNYWELQKQAAKPYAPKGPGGAASHPGGSAAAAAEKAAIEAKAADEAAIKARTKQAKLEKEARREARKERERERESRSQPAQVQRQSQPRQAAHRSSADSPGHDSSTPFIPHKIQLMDHSAVPELHDGDDVEKWYDLMTTAVDCATWQTDDPTQREQLRRHALGLVVGRLRDNYLKDWQALSVADKHRLKVDITAWRELIIEPSLPDPTTRKLDADDRYWQFGKESFEEYVRDKKAKMVRVRPELGEKEHRRELWLIVRCGIRETEYQIHFSAPQAEPLNEQAIREQIKEIDRLVEARQKKDQQKKAKRAAEAKQAEAKQGSDFRNPSRSVGGSRGEAPAASSRPRPNEVFDPKRMGTKKIDGKEMPTYTREDGSEIVLRRPCRHCKKMHPDFACKAVSAEGKAFNVEGGPRWTFTDQDVEDALQDCDSETASTSTEGYASAKEEAGFRRGSARQRS